MQVDPKLTPSAVLPLATLRPHPRNYNRHSAQQIQRIAASLSKFGQVRAIVVWRSTILAGHGVVEAARQLGWRDIRADVLPDDYPEHLALAYVVADNELARLSDPDEAALAALLDEARAEDAGLLAAMGYDEREFQELLARVGGGEDAITPEQARQTLAERFIVPPFSVLDARQGYWQARKSAWIALGIQSELGRGADIVPNGSERPPDQDGAWRRLGRVKGKLPAVIGGQPLPLDRKANGRGPGRFLGQDLMKGEHVVGENRLTWVAGTRDRDSLDDTSRKNLAAGRYSARPPHGATVTQNPDGSLADRPTNNGEGASGTSIFDPVLCELAYTWFCPPNGRTLDPFAGGSVRGVVAGYLGRRYTGIDLRPEQVEANQAQAAVIVPGNVPRWIVGDSRDSIPTESFDFVFSCPPYADLEIYSDDPRDISNMDYGEFLAAYRDIIAQSITRLTGDRFACFVVGDIRDKKGLYRNFVSDTITAFHDAGARLYNEAILVTAVGSLPIRVGKQFSGGRKLGKTHQNVLVFVKGDPRKAADACGTIEVTTLDAPP